MSTEPHGATAEVEDPLDAPAAASGPGDPAATGPVVLTSPVEVPPLEAVPLVVTPTERTAPIGRKVRRGRRVKRVVRRIELWSVLKLALVFYTCVYVVVLGALAIIWSFAYKAGLVDNFESFANDVGFEHWQFYGAHMFRQAAIIGAVLVVAATIMTVLATALLNVISELTGGIRLVVIEEEISYVLPDQDLPTAAPAGAPRTNGSAAPSPVARRRR